MVEKGGWRRNPQAAAGNIHDGPSEGKNTSRAPGGISRWDIKVTPRPQGKRGTI